MTLDSDMYRVAYTAGAVQSQLNYNIGVMIRNKEILKGKQIANNIRAVIPSDNNSYVAQNRLTTIWTDKTNSQDGLVSRILNIRYEGEVNIGDRNIITEEISNPISKMLEEAKEDFIPISFIDYIKERGICTCGTEDGLLLCCSCAICWPFMRILGCYVGYKDGYKEESVKNLAEIKTEQFWSFRLTEAQKKADVFVNERILETRSSEQRRENYNYSRPNPSLMI